MGCLCFIVTGRVQGVGFRAYVKDKAQSLFITGWVRNRKDGTVEVSACGADTSLLALEQALAKGPRGAQVLRIEKHPSFEAVSQTRFLVRRDDTE